MIILTGPLFYDGRLLPAGEAAGLPSVLEQKLVAAGNAVPCARDVTPPPAEPQAEPPAETSAEPPAEPSVAIVDAALGRPGIQGAAK